MKQDNVHSDDTNGQDPEVQALLKDYPTVDPRIAEGRRRADGSGPSRDPLERYMEETLPPVAEAAK